MVRLKEKGKMESRRERDDMKYKGLNERGKERHLKIVRERKRLKDGEKESLKGIISKADLEIEAIRDGGGDAKKE